MATIQGGDNGFDGHRPYNQIGPRMVDGAPKDYMFFIFLEVWKEILEFKYKGTDIVFPYGNVHYMNNNTASMLYYPEGDQNLPYNRVGVSFRDGTPNFIRDNAFLKIDGITNYRNYRYSTAAQIVRLEDLPRLLDSKRYAGSIGMTDNGDFYQTCHRVRCVPLLRENYIGSEPDAVNFFKDGIDLALQGSRPDIVYTARMLDTEFNQLHAGKVHCNALQEMKHWEGLRDHGLMYEAVEDQFGRSLSNADGEGWQDSYNVQARSLEDKIKRMSETDLEIFLESRWLKADAEDGEFGEERFNKLPSEQAFVSSVGHRRVDIEAKAISRLGELRRQGRTEKTRLPFQDIRDRRIKAVPIAFVAHLNGGLRSRRNPNGTAVLAPGAEWNLTNANFEHKEGNIAAVKPALTFVKYGATATDSNAVGPSDTSGTGRADTVRSKHDKNASGAALTGDAVDDDALTRTWHTNADWPYTSDAAALTDSNRNGDPRLRSDGSSDAPANRQAVGLTDSGAAKTGTASAHFRTGTWESGVKDPNAPPLLQPIPPGKRCHRRPHAVGIRR